MARSVVLLVVLSSAVAVGCGARDEVRVELRDDATPVLHEFVVPAGTEAVLDAGGTVEVVPQVLEVTVGDSIRIRNDDVSTAQVGIFNVAAGETVTMEFTSPGELVGACDVHPSGEFRIRVSRA